MPFVINSRKMLEEWMDAMLATSDFPHDDVLIRDYYFRPWIIVKSDDDGTYWAYGIALPEEDWFDVAGVDLNVLSFPVKVYG